MNGCFVERGSGFVLWHCTKGSPEHYLTVSFDAPAPDYTAVCGAAYSKLVTLIERDGLQVVQERIFGSLNHHVACESARRLAVRNHPAFAGPEPTYVQGRPLWGDGLAGIQIHAVRPKAPMDRIEQIMVDGHPVGRVWRHQDATLIWLQNLHGFSARESMASMSAKSQSEAMFQKADAILREQGTDYASVGRTWIYLSDILRWYDDFNEVRNRLYTQWGLMPNSAKEAATALRLPASTGIRGDNPRASACVMDALAVKTSPSGPLAVTQLTNPKQKDAFKYQKAFSRGAFIHGDGVAQIQISGTAAIDELGVSLFTGDTKAQIERTLENVQSLVQPCGAGLRDISGATIFLKSADDAATCREVFRAWSLENLPAVWMVGDVCRAELLFEMDAVALGPFA